MDKELLDDVRGCSNKYYDFIELTSCQSLNTGNLVADKFIKNRNNVWWWEDLTQDSVTIPYGDNDGLSVIKQIVCDNTIIVNFFITDDEPEPWPIFQGSLETVINVVSEQRYFEFFITPLDLSWLIFDTHHNSLIISGELVESAKSI